MQAREAIDKFFQNKPQLHFNILIFALAIALRLLYVWILKNNYLFYNHPSSDVTYYLDWAREIMANGWLGSKTFYGLPLFPYFLAVLKGISLGSVPVMHFFYILLGSLNCVLIYFVARKPFSEIIARLAAVLAATNFILIHFDWLMMPVTLLITLSLIIVLALMYRDNLTKKREWFILGILIGLSTQGDGKFLIFLAFLGIYFLRQLVKNRRAELLRKTVALFCGALVLIFAVAVRNKIVGGDWVLVSAQSGLSFFVGNNRDASGVFENPEFIRPTHGGQDEDQRIVAEAMAKKSLTDREVSNFWKQKAMDFILQDPAGYLKLLSRKFVLFFSETEYAHDLDLILQRAWRLKFDVNPFPLICPLAVLGLILAWRQERENPFINLLLLSQLVITVLFFLTSRHRATVLPFFLIYEAYFFCWLGQELRRQKWLSLLIPIVFVGGYLFFLPPRLVAATDFAFLQHSKAGPIYDKQKNFAQARVEYLQALNLRPYDSNTLYNLGTSYLLEEKIPEAQSYFKKALAICNYNVDALFDLGYTYEATKQFDLAIQTYRQVLNYQSDSPDVYYRIGFTYQQKGDCPNAQKYYSVIAQQRPALRAEIDKMIGECR